MVGTAAVMFLFHSGAPVNPNLKTSFSEYLVIFPRIPTFATFQNSLRKCFSISSSLDYLKVPYLVQHKIPQNFKIGNKWNMRETSEEQDIHLGKQGESSCETQGKL